MYYSLLDEFAAYFKCSPACLQLRLCSSRDRENVCKVFQGKKLTTTYLDRKGRPAQFNFAGLTNAGADVLPAYGNLRAPFNVSVAAHYYARHRIMLKYSTLPCVMEQAGEDDTNDLPMMRFYPLELVRLIKDNCDSSSSDNITTTTSPASATGKLFFPPLPPTPPSLRKLVFKENEESEEEDDVSEHEYATIDDNNNNLFDWNSAHLADNNNRKNNNKDISSSSEDDEWLSKKKIAKAPLSSSSSRVSSVRSNAALSNKPRRLMQKRQQQQQQLEQYKYPSSGAIFIKYWRWGPPNSSAKTGRDSSLPNWELDRMWIEKDQFCELVKTATTML